METANNHQEEELVYGFSDWMEFAMGENGTPQQRMFTSYSYFTTFWEHALHPIAIVSEEGVIKAANPAFCNLLGISQQDVINLEINRFLAVGTLKEDLRIIDTLFNCNALETVTDENWNYKLERNGTHIPVRIKAIRIPNIHNTEFRHIIIQVYDKRVDNERFSATQTWSEKTWGEISKELFVKHFGKILSVIILMAILLGLTGHLGDTVDKVIDSLNDNKPVPQYTPIPNPQPEVKQ